jgi:hypothetical protein
MAGRWKVRFHLGKGPHFRQWQVKSPDGTVTYHDPDTTSLVMWDCRLLNHRKTAERIHAGENKTVCAWVSCDQVVTFPRFRLWEPIEQRRLAYDPRVAPHWRMAGPAGRDVDGKQFHAVVSEGRSLYAGLDK